MGNIDDLRTAGVRRLESIPALAGVPVIGDDRLDIDTEIRKALGTGGGLALTVGLGSMKCLQPANPSPTVEVELVVEIAEIPPINRGPGGRRIPGITAAVIAAKALHHHGWETGRTLVLDEIIYDKDSKLKLVIYTLVFKTHVTFDVELGV
jgi:hypothetical protein